jgi:hypothetical protein
VYISAVNGWMLSVVGRVNRPFASVGRGENVSGPVAWGWRAIEGKVA